MSSKAESSSGKAPSDSAARSSILPEKAIDAYDKTEDTTRVPSEAEKYEKTADTPIDSPVPEKSTTAHHEETTETRSSDNTPNTPNNSSISAASDPDPDLFPETCNLCNEEICAQCDPDSDHVCGMYMEAARKRNGNALRGNEYMSMMTWSWQCLLNVVVPGRFFRDLDVGSDGLLKRERFVVLRYGLWGVATMGMLLVYPFLLGYSVVMVLLEDSVWREDAG